jgi:hypothetical protein
LAVLDTPNGVGHIPGPGPEEEGIFMKRFVALFAVLSLLLLVGGFVTAAPAFAGHKVGHAETPACDKSSGKGVKHCYPPGPNSSSSSGLPASFVTEGPQESGITVGMATVLAVGALGTLLLIRRRWVFKPDSD